MQSNYGGVLEIAGVPVGQMLEHYYFRENIMQDVDGSCMMVVITDAPVDSRNLERMAKRAMMGLAKTGGIASNGSGDYVIALSVNKDNLVNDDKPFYETKVLKNDDMSPLFLATIEATAEALWNSLFTAKEVKGYKDNLVKPIPVEKIVEYIKNAENANPPKK